MYNNPINANYIYFHLLILAMFNLAQTADEMKKSQQFEQKAIANYKEKDLSNF